MLGQKCVQRDSCVTVKWRQPENRFRPVWQPWGTESGLSEKNIRDSWDEAKV